MAKRTIREEWRPVPGHPGYEVSDRGRVRSYRRFSQGRLLSPGDNGLGHRQLKLGNPQRTEYIHNLVLLAFRGPPPTGLEACHNNGVPFDNRLSNLRYDTHRNNILDCAKHGTANRGSRHYLTKLTEESVRSIRRSALPQRILSERYGVSQRCISDIRRRKTWGWLE